MISKISERSYLLEIVKIVGILLWYLLTSVTWIISPKENVAVSQILLIRLLQAVSGYLMISLFFIFLNRMNKKSVLTNKLFILLLFPICFLISMFWNLLGDFSGWIFKFNSLDIINKYLFASTLFFLIPTIAFTGLYYSISYWINYKIQREKALIATNLAHEAQLEMLRYQINPHFLFNVLNTIRLKVEEDKDSARKMITELANFFRYSLSQKENMVSLGNEIKAIKNYFEIQKIRFEEKLVVEYDIDESVNEVELPFFIVLPLVENALKYGLQTSTMPLTIKICAKLGNHLEISVQNSGKLVTNATAAESTGTGIENIRKRLELCYPGNYSFSITEKDSLVTAQIVISNLHVKCPEMPL